MQQRTAHLYEFGPFLLDTAQHVLTRDGEPVALTPKTYDLLHVLVANRGRLLSKDELMRTLWPHTVVEESNLTQQVSMIRRALGETAGEHRYIVTVPGRGYRFAAEVTEVTNEEPAGATAAQTEVISAVVPSRQRDRRPILTAIAAAVVIAVIAVGYATYRRAVVPGPKESNAARSLAILPFQSLRADPKTDFLGFSLADAVITQLDSVSALAVRPSSAIAKYRNQPIDLRSAAADLHVDTVLTGNLIRDGDDLRITSQLIEVSTQNILWKRTFDVKYDKLLTLQDAVAQEIIRGLKLGLSAEEAARLKSHQPGDPAAYEYYLRGIDLYSRNEFPMAIKMLEQSVQIDPTYALAWAHLGRAHTANASFELGGRDEDQAAQAAYERALAIEPSQIEAQIFMANRFTDTGRVENAVPLLRQALKANPNHPEVHWELGYAYRFGGMLRESAAECERARQIDPGVKLSTSTLNSYLYLGEYDRFLASLPASANSGFLLFYRGFGLFYKKAYDEALKNFDQAFSVRPSMLQARVGKALSYGIRRQNGDGLALLKQTENTATERGVGDSEAMYKIAQAYAVLGDKTSALRVLRRSIEGGFFSYPYFASDPLLDSVRSEPGFEPLMALARNRHEKFKKTFF